MNETGTVWLTCLPVIASVCSLKFGDVLNVDRAHHLDPGNQEFLNVLPTSRIPGAGRIVVRQAVDETHQGAPPDQRLDVNSRAMAGGLQGNDLQLPQNRLNFRRHGRLNRANHHVLTALLAAPGFVKHANRLADPRCIAEEDLQVSPPVRGLAGFDFPQEFFGALTLFFEWHGDHRITQSGCSTPHPPSINSLTIEK